MSQFNRTVSDSIVKEALFLWVFLIVIFSWILIDCWGRVVNNFAFVTLKLNERSLYDTFIFALALTLIVFVMIIFLKSIGLNYETSIAGDQIDDIYDKSSDNVTEGSSAVIPPIIPLEFFAVV